MPPLPTDAVILYDKNVSGSSAELKYIDYGLSVLEPSVIADYVASGEVVDLSQVYKELSVAGQLAGYEVNDRFFEVGSPSGLKDLEHLLRRDGQTTC